MRDCNGRFLKGFSHNKGRIPSIEARKKMSLSKKNRPKEIVQKFTDILIKNKRYKKGDKMSNDTKEKLRQNREYPTWLMVPEVQIKRIQSLKGCKHSEESKLKRRGENHYHWKKDRSTLKKYEGSEERRSQEYKHFRKQVHLRDNFKCRINNNECSGRIEVHHILGWKDYPELRHIINNGITLCHFHHPRKREEEKRLSPYFMELVSVSKV